MPNANPAQPTNPLVDLRGKKGLVIGIANEHSIASGCAEAFVRAGAVFAATYLSEKAKPFVAPVADKLGCELLLPCDVRIPGQLEEVFSRIKSEWGHLDFLLHSIAFAPREDLHGRVTDCSVAGFDLAMEISCHSFIRMAHLAEPLMQNGGCLLAVTFYGSEHVVKNYNLMGPVKAALESSTATSPPNSDQKAFAPTRSLRVRSRPARPAASTGSTNCWKPRRPAPRNINSWTLRMSEIWRRSSSVTPLAGLPAPSSRSMAALISLLNPPSKLQEIGPSSEHRSKRTLRRSFH